MKPRHSFISFLIKMFLKIKLHCFDVIWSNTFLIYLVLDLHVIGAGKFTAEEQSILITCIIISTINILKKCVIRMLILSMATS